MNWSDKVWKKYLEDYYRRNDHHPEYFEVNQTMSSDAKKHLTCDLLGSVMGQAKKHKINLTISQCRAYIEHHRFPKWIHAITENLPPPSENVPVIPPRWNKTFDGGELIDLMQDIIENLESVQYFLFDLFCQREAVYKVWKEISTQYDQSFRVIEERILNHDLDKYRRFSIIANTAHFCTFTPTYASAFHC